MRRNVLSRMIYLAVPCFSTLSHKRHDFREKVAGHKMCVLILSTTLYELFIILRKIQRDLIINVHRYSCKVLGFLDRF